MIKILVAWWRHRAYARERMMQAAEHAGVSFGGREARLPLSRLPWQITVDGRPFPTPEVAARDFAFWALDVEGWPRSLATRELWLRSLVSAFLVGYVCATGKARMASCFRVALGLEVGP